MLHFCGVRHRCPQRAKPGAKNAELLKTCFLNWFLRKHLASLPRKQVDIFAPISYIDNPFLLLSQDLKFKSTRVIVFLRVMVQQIKNYKLVLKKNKLSGVSLFLEMECWQSFVGSKVRHRGQELLNNTILREKKMFKNEYCLEFLALSAFFMALARFSSR